MVPLQQQWLRSVLTMVPQSLMKGRDRQLLTEDLLKEIVRDYEKSMQRCVCKYYKLLSTCINVSENKLCILLLKIIFLVVSARRN